MSTCCDVRLERCQAAGDAELHEIDVSTARRWRASSPVTANSVYRPTECRQTGFVYVAAAAGQTGALEPTWPTTVGGTVVDGSIIWTAAVPPATGQDTIASATWALVNPPDSALTISDVTFSGLTTSALIGGGTQGQLYTIQVTITTVAGMVKNVFIDLSVD